jgi:hypothetical protein
VTVSDLLIQPEDSYGHSRPPGVPALDAGEQRGDLAPRSSDDGYRPNLLIGAAVLAVLGLLGLSVGVFARLPERPFVVWLLASSTSVLLLAVVLLLAGWRWRPRR